MHLAESCTYIAREEAGPENLSSGIERLAQGIPDKYQKRQDHRQGKERGKAQPRRLQVLFALGHQLPSEALPAGMPKPRKSSAVSVVIAPVSMKGT